MTSLRPGAIRTFADLLGRHRQLTIDMALREISERYSGQVFGTFWTIGHPLVLITTYVVVFRFVLKSSALAPAGSSRDYIVYILSGLIPWLACIEAMNKATTAIVSNASLVKQVVFPLEVLPAKGVIATLITHLILLAIVIAYSIVASGEVPAVYVLLPVLIVLQVTMMLGVCYILSAVGAFFRDIKDLIQIFGQIGVYFIPAFYAVTALPAPLQWLVYLNPFSHLVWCYQDVLYFGSIAHPWSWAIASAVSVAAFWGGSRFFALLKPLFGNVL